MSAEQIATRIISAQTGIPSTRIFSGQISPEEFQRISDVAQNIETIPLYIDDTGAISLSQLSLRANQLKDRHGLDLLVIDTVQSLRQVSGRIMGLSSIEMSTVTGTLKLIAKELAVPVLAVARLEKPGVASDVGPRIDQLDPSLEQDADLVLFLFRVERVLRRNEPAPGTNAHFAWQSKIEVAQGRAEIAIAKNRHGPTGTVIVDFDARVGRFSDISSDGSSP